MIWTSDKGNPPFFTLVANGVIEYLLGHKYFLSAYVADHSADKNVVVIDISERHRIFPEFPGPTLGRVVHGPGETEIHAVGRHQEDGLSLDAADPKSLPKLGRFFRDAGRLDPARSASKRLS